MPTPIIWNIPYQRNPFFTGREDILSQLHHVLHAENAVTLSHPQGISGLGGIGKTQTALEYAYRYRAEYAAVSWVHADLKLALITSLIGLAQLLELPERNEQDHSIIVEAVWRWLRLHTGWLLIFDNMDDLTLAEPLLPKVGRGHLLFTTRAHALGGIAERIEVQPMERETGALFLLRRANVLPLQATLDRATSNDLSVACKISQELDGLPLALDQAAAYVNAQHCSLSAYLDLYRKRSKDLLQTRGSFDTDYPESVATTWSLSLEKVAQVSPTAASLLYFCAFLYPNAIAEEIITEGEFTPGSALQSIATDPLKFDAAMKEILEYSLLYRNADEQSLSIHRLVQQIIQEHMSDAEKRRWASYASHTINSAWYHTTDTATRHRRLLYLPQIQITIPYIIEASFSDFDKKYLDSYTSTPFSSDTPPASLASSQMQILKLTEEKSDAEFLDLLVAYHKRMVMNTLNVLQANGVDEQHFSIQGCRGLLLKLSSLLQIYMQSNIHSLDAQAINDQMLQLIPCTGYL